MAVVGLSFRQDIGRPPHFNKKMRTPIPGVRIFYWTMYIFSIFQGKPSKKSLWLSVSPLFLRRYDYVTFEPPALTYTAASNSAPLLRRARTAGV